MLRTLARLTIAATFLLISKYPASAQDAFDSSGATGSQTNNSGYFTGSQTMEGFDRFDSAAPQLQGATNGTIGPQGDDATVIQGVNTAGEINYSDRPMDYKELKIRDLLLSPVACEEPVPPGVFPPMPQVPVLPEPSITHESTINPTYKRLSKSNFEQGKRFIKDGKLQQAGDKFSKAICFAIDELHMREEISAFLAKQTEEKRGARATKHSPDYQLNLARLAVFFDQSSASNILALDECIKAQGSNPADFESRCSMASQLESQGNSRLAVAEWLAATKLKDSVSLRTKLAAALIAADCDLEAMTQLRRVVSMDWPENKKAEHSTCHRLLAEIFLKYSHQYRDRGARGTSIALLENAAMDARRAVVINPLDASADKLFLSIAEEANSISPSEIDNNLLMAAGYMLRGDFRKADSTYAECDNLDAQDPRLSYARVVYQVIRSNPARSSKGMVEASIAKVKDLLSDDPNNDQLWKFLGRLQEQGSNKKEAQESFEKAKQLYWTDFSKTASQQ